jgi:outer membrane protein TolC
MRSLSLPLLLLLAPCAASAQTRPQIPPVLTLREAVDMALRNSPALRGAQARITQEDARTRAAGSSRLPQADISGYESGQTENLRAYGLNTPLFNLNTGPFATFDARLGVTYNFWSPALRKKEVALAAEADASREDQNDARETLIGEVAEAFRLVSYGQDLERALASQAGTAAQLWKIVEERYEKGTGSALEPNRAKQETLRIQSLQVDAAIALERSKIALARLLNARIGTSFEAADEDSPRTLPASPEALKTALESRAGYHAAQARVAAAEAAFRAVRAQRLPTAQFHVDAGMNGDSPAHGILTYRAIASLQIPVFHAELAPAEAEAQARVKEAQAAAEEIRNNVEAEVSTALAQCAATQQKMEIALQIRDLTRQELELASRRLTAGVTDNEEALAAQERVLRAEENIAEVQFELRRLRYELYRKMGKVEEIYRP